MFSSLYLFNFLKYLARAMTLLLVLPLHEAAHGFVAKLMGDDTAERQGRITINPFVHLDLYGSLLILLTGFGWAKPVLVNPARMKNRRLGLALTSLAGPFSNLLAAFVFSLVYNLMLCSESVLISSQSSDITAISCIMSLLSFLFSVNIGLAMFNLLPIPPLDGFNVLRAIVGTKLDIWYFKNQQTLRIVTIIMIIIIIALPSDINPLYYLDSFMSDVISNLTSWIPKLRWGY